MSIPARLQDLRAQLDRAKGRVERVQEQIYNLQNECPHPNKSHPGWGAMYQWHCPDCQHQWDDY